MGVGVLEEDGAERAGPAGGRPADDLVVVELGERRREREQAGATVVERVAARGDTPLERLISLVLLGDLVSLYLAVLAGTDPVDIAPIDRLKASLANR